MSILIDTNILIAVLNKTIAPEIMDQYPRVAISVITIMEMYALAGLSEKEENEMKADMYLMDILPVTNNIARQAGLLSRTRRRGVRSDLLIAATALV